jgi:lysophospholipase L1-like esterase
VKLARIAVLGDSYASGEGAKAAGESYDTHFVFNVTDLAATLTDDRRCRRSTSAYGRRLAQTWGNPELMFTACSGALIEHVGSSPQYPTMRTQQAWLDEFAKRGPIDAVILTISGNDQGFGKVIEECLSSRCVENGVEKLRPFLEENAPKTTLALTTLLLGIRQSVGAGTPVLITGYPQILPSRAAFGCLSEGVQSIPGVPSLEEPELAFMRSGYALQNTIVRDAANAAGVYFIDVENIFANHLVCDVTPYAHGIVPRVAGGEPAGGGFQSQVGAPDSFHPTPQGHACIAHAVLAQYPDPTKLEPPAIGAAPVSQPAIGSAAPCR